MSTKIEIKNAKIRSTMLGREDHGIFTAYVMVEVNAWGCGFGGYAFDTYNKDTEEKDGLAFGIDFIARVLSTVGVEKWEDLPGQHVRVETEGWGGRIFAIGHIVEDKWFRPTELAKKHWPD